LGHTDLRLQLGLKTSRAASSSKYSKNKSAKYFHEIEEIELDLILKCFLECFVDISVSVNIGIIKFSIVDISAAVGPSSVLSLICDHDVFPTGQIDDVHGDHGLRGLRGLRGMRRIRM
jgi:hypothetical protein